MTPGKCFAFGLLVIFFGLIAGCGTCKGAAEGFKKDWAGLQKADRWVQKNIW